MNKKLASVVARVFEVDASALGEDLTPGRIKQWTSLAYMKLISELEKEFKISFSIDDVIEVKKLGDFQRLLIKYGAISNELKD